MNEAERMRVDTVVRRELCVRPGESISEVAARIVETGSMARRRVLCAAAILAEPASTPDEAWEHMVLAAAVLEGHA